MTRHAELSLLRANHSDIVRSLHRSRHVLAHFDDAKRYFFDGGNQFFHTLLIYNKGRRLAAFHRHLHVFVAFRFYMLLFCPVRQSFCLVCCHSHHCFRIGRDGGICLTCIDFCHHQRRAKFFGFRQQVADFFHGAHPAFANIYATMSSQSSRDADAEKTMTFGSILLGERKRCRLQVCPRSSHGNDIVVL